MENVITTGYLHVESVSYDIPCFSCVKSDVCKYRKEVEEIIPKINSEYLSKNEILNVKFSCKKARLSNKEITYRGFASNDNSVMLCNKVEK
ncbi:hypothetical protein [Faecalibacillus intestinalis]|uniref:hypothetical protein n=1 Tax=Faecalibacillus intestinalis TaxID=1982626 RepID=UPI0039A232C7